MATPLHKPPSDPLAALRDRLDRVDIELHRLLRERFELSATIGASKGPDESVIRPAREAAVIENRLAVHTGACPAAVVAHIWRVVIAASSAVQRPFAVHVAGALDAARFLYGPAEVLMRPSAADAVAALARRPRDIAVIALGSADRWWVERGPAHAIGVIPLSDGGRAVVLGGAGVAPGTGPAALAIRDRPVELRTADLLPDDDVVGSYHPFPLTVPVAEPVAPAIALDPAPTSPRSAA